MSNKKGAVNFPTIEQWSPPVKAYLFMRQFARNKISDEEIDKYSPIVVAKRGFNTGLTI